ncbi:uncharacterized protein LOC117787998 [Drosophila innubila]|uniref:uncharacterized protein LOC117787998 n=1 Tax=Drosophila innubila TaxID=198719 RepID=UPI00148D76A1|nr:uncharacterized protein LOC117787998 [Drosophila innubila]
MNNEFSLLNEMQENCKLYGMVEVDQLRSTWKARKFPIEVPVSIVQSGLLPSIFDWPLMGQLMPMEQAMGEAMLQQRINDLELLNSLTTSLQRIEIVPELGIEVDVVLGRPSYNVQVQDNGSIVVKELPSLHIHIYAVETRAVAGQECDLDNDQDNEQDNEDEDEVDGDGDADAEDEISNNNNTDNHNTDNKNTPNKSMQLTLYKKDSQESLDYMQSYEECGNLTDPDEPTDFLTESDDQADIKLRRRMSFWMRFGNWLRQSMPRLN